MKIRNVVISGIAILAFSGGCAMCKNNYSSEVEKLGLRLNETQDMLMRPQKPFPNDLVIPDGVQFINKEVFRSFPKLESVVMPDSVIQIGDYVFAGSRKLRKVKMSSSLKHTGNFTY